MRLTIAVWEVELPAASRTVGDPGVTGGSTSRRLERRREIRWEVANALTSLLARQLGVRPETIEYDRRCHHCGHATHGKPSLASPSGAPLDFSVSYSVDHALVAISSGCRIGVDIEQVVLLRNGSSWWLGPDELSRLARVNTGVRARHLVEAWVRKEAYAKGCGRGLAMDLASLRTFGARADWHLPEGWQLEDLRTDRDLGAVAAVAYESATVVPIVFEGTIDIEDCGVTRAR